MPSSRWRCLLCEAEGGNGQPEWIVSAFPRWDQYAHYLLWHTQAADVRR